MKEKLTITVMIEGGKTFTADYVPNQKVEVLVNRVESEFKIQNEKNRKLMRSDESIISNYNLTLDTIGVRDGETLKFIAVNAPVPDKPKKFA
jgi:hypothetical protein